MLFKRSFIAKILSFFLIIMMSFGSAPAMAAGAQSLSVYAGINVSQDLYEKAIAEFEKAPTSIKLAFLNDGWGIGIIMYDIDTLYYNNAYGSVAATTRYSENMIYVENREAGINAIIHELGHFLDMKLGMLSSTQEWNAAFMAEAKDVSSYATTNEMEGFAESFSKYINSPNALEAKCPRIFDYVSRAVAEVDQLHSSMTLPRF